MKLQSIWITENDGNYNIAMRANTSREVVIVPRLSFIEITLPPLNTVMNIDKAREERLQQDHYNLSGFTLEDLYLLYNKLGEYLNG